MRQLICHLIKLKNRRKFSLYKSLKINQEYYIRQGQSQSPYKNINNKEKTNMNKLPEYNQKYYIQLQHQELSKNQYNLKDINRAKKYKHK